MRETWYNNDMNNDAIFICINFNDEGEIAHLEVIDAPPSPNAIHSEAWDRIYEANINGGDSIEFTQR